jgi:hypothetical protein
MRSEFFCTPEKRLSPEAFWPAVEFIASRWRVKKREMAGVGVSTN